MRTSYVRWYILRELAHGRVLVFLYPPGGGKQQVVLAGKGRPLEDVPYRTANDLVRYCRCSEVSLPLKEVPVPYLAYECSTTGWREAQKLIFGTHEFWSWFGGSYKFSKKRMMYEMGRMRDEPHPFAYSPPNLKEWRTRV